MKRLLILMKEGITAEQAKAVTEGLEERLGVDVVVLSGAIQALMVEEDS